MVEREDEDGLGNVVQSDALEDLIEDVVGEGGGGSSTELLSTSVVSGVTTLSGSRVLVGEPGPRSWDSEGLYLGGADITILAAEHMTITDAASVGLPGDGNGGLYAGNLYLGAKPSTTGPGNITVTDASGANAVNGQYARLSGGDAVAGIRGNANLFGGSVRLQAGKAHSDSEGESLGAALSVNGGQVRDGTSHGGSLQAAAGAINCDGGVGGDAFLLAGSGTGVGSKGGEARLVGGGGLDNDSDGGDANIYAGAAFYSGNGGHVNITGGNSPDGTSGNVVIRPGGTSTGEGGEIYIFAHNNDCPFIIDKDARLIMEVPTSDPHHAGQVYWNSGVLTRSAG